MGTKIIEGAIVLVVSLIVGTFALSCFKHLIKNSAARRNAETGSSIDVDKISIGWLPGLIVQVILAILSVCSTLLGNLALSIMLVLVLIAGIAMSVGTTNRDKRIVVAMFRSLALPFTVGLIYNIIATAVSSGWQWSYLYWLAVPVVVYIGLAVTGAIRHEEDDDLDSDNGSSGWGKTILCLAVLAAFVLGSVFGLKALQNNLKQRDLERIAAAEADDTEDIDPLEAINLAFSNHSLSEEEKALEDGMVLPQLDPEDSESKLSEFALGPIPEEMLAPMREWLGWEVDWSSYPVNPVTEELMTEARTHSAKKLGYVDYSMSFASAPGFPKDYKDYIKLRDMDPETTEEEAIMRWVGDLTGNYPVFLGMVHLFGQAKTFGVNNCEIEGNEFFKEIEELAREAEEEGKGITKFLDAEAYPKYSKYNFDWQCYRAKFMFWLQMTDFVGRKEWWSIEKSYLGPADGKATEKFEYKFDYTNAAYVAPNFTTDKQRQTDLPSYPFCFRDKNGYRVSDFFGLNATDADAELYAEQPAAKKANLTGYNPKQPSGSTKIAYSADTGKITTEKKDDPKKDDPKPKKKTTPKGKENSSVNKPENIIDGKNPIGVGTDAFQPDKPATGGLTVETSQYQPQAAEQGGGESHQVAQKPGTTIQDGNKQVTARETPAGVVVTDEYTPPSTSGGNDGTFVENAEAATSPIPVKEEEYKDNASAGNESTGNTEKNSEPLEDEFW